jgi:hypothetical protein
MKNPFRGGSANEFGAILPDEKAQLCEESERIQAYNLKQAKEKCKEIAEEYGGIDPSPKSIGKGEFDRRFKVWREP